ncbi:MAG: hypothetical protein F6K55_21550 [Moorea sp. SIO4A3]|nr:hypothetical protein [Moorena sp. SIO4A3]
MGIQKYQHSAVSIQLSAVSIQLSAVSIQLSAVSIQLSAFSYQHSAYGLDHRLEACATVLLAQGARSSIGAFESNKLTADR